MHARLNQLMRANFASNSQAQPTENTQMGEDHLSEEEQAKLKELLIANAEVFALDSSKLGTTGVVTHTVNNGDHPPIRQHPRRMPFALRDEVTQMVQEILDNNVIQPCDSPKRKMDPSAFAWTIVI